MELQPYFDKLNGNKSSKEILTLEEYERYVEELMTYEKVLAQKELQEEFQQAKNFLEYVTNKPSLFGVL